MEEGFTPIGITNYRNINLKFGIKDKDKLQHIYTIGKSGTGKSTLLKNMALSDIKRGHGILVIDPHSDVAEDLLRLMPKERKHDLIYFNPKDTNNQVVFNPLSDVNTKYHHLVASGLISTFKKIWFESWGPRMEYILRFTLLTLLCVPEATLLDIQPLLTDLSVRERYLAHVDSDHIHRFWEFEFAKYSPSLRAEAVSPILNKVGLFTTSTPLRMTFGQKERGLRLQEIMDKRKILICNLSKGELGEDASTLLGSILLTSIQNAALYRARQDENSRVPFYIYVDEMQSYVTLSFADLLSESRKYGISLFLTNQYVTQLDEKVRDAVFGNVGTLITFRVGAVDAEYLAKEFYPVFSEEDLVSLPRYCMYLKLMIDGTTSQPFSAISIPGNSQNQGF